MGARLRATAASVAFLLASAHASADKPVKLVILAGQSNMVGYGDGAALPPELRLQREVLYDHDNRDARVGGPFAGATSTDWGPLSPKGSRSSYGPEITFGQALAAAFPAHRIALVKLAQGGTNLVEHWGRGLPAVTDYPHKSQLYHVLLGSLDSATYDAARGNALAHPSEPSRVDAAIARLAAAKRNYEIAGFVWMQGENEAGWEAALDYRRALTALILALRQDLSAPDLPVVLGRVSDNLYARNGGPIPEAKSAMVDAVRGAQVAVADADSLVEWVDTDDLSARPGDPYHFDDAGYRALGERFARTLVTLARTDVGDAGRTRLAPLPGDDGSGRGPAPAPSPPPIASVRTGARGGCACGTGEERPRSGPAWRVWSLVSAALVGVARRRRRAPRAPSSRRQ